MLSVALFAIVVILVNGQRSTPDYINNLKDVEGPRLYSFNYRSILKDGVGESSRSESADGTGKVQGSYSLTNAEGHYRVVEYIADQDGFRAVIRTNEPGTRSNNPADVIVQSESGPLEYNPVVRRPATEEPVPPVIKPVITPESVRVPSRRPVYRRPAIYSDRYRNPRINAGFGLNQNVPTNRLPVSNSASEPVTPKLEPADVPADDLVPILPIL